MAGRRPSFALVQALQLVAAGTPVARAADDSGIHNGRVWTAMKSHGQGRETSRERASLALQHYTKLMHGDGEEVPPPSPAIVTW